MAMRQRVRRKQEAISDASEGEASARTRIASPAVHASLLANPWPGARRHGRPTSRPWSTFLLVQYVVPSHRVSAALRAVSGETPSAVQQWRTTPHLTRTPLLPGGEVQTRQEP